MLKTNYLLTPLALTAIAAPNAEAATKSQQPNIVYIYADDMGYGDIGYLNPESKIETPNLDKLAAQGLNFTDAHTCSSVSSPSRYGVITGRYAWRSPLKRGVLGGFSPALIERDRPTVASMLRDNGYQTYCIGKWHLGLDGWVNKDGSGVKQPRSLNETGRDVDYANVKLSGPSDRGFDYFYGLSASLDIPPFLLIENDRVIDEASHFYDKKSPYQRGGYAVEGRLPSYFMEHFTDKVIETIQSSSKSEKPFFIYYGVTAPHTPVAPHEDFVGKSEAGEYGDFMMELDYRIGQIYAGLESAGVADNTIVVISSDNGPETITYERYCKTGHCSSGELKGVKRDIWEGGHRVPMIVTWPDVIKRGRNVEQTVSVIDFYATAAEIVGMRWRMAKLRTATHFYQ